MDMLEVPEKIKPLVADYKMNLLELRTSGSLQFHNQDVNTVFDISRSIYERDYNKINTVYKDRLIASELGVVIGAITQSQELIDHALELEQKGGQVNMCSALEELKMEGKQEGKKEGLQEGMIAGTIKTCKKFKLDQKAAIKNVMEEFSLSEEDAIDYVKKYW